MRQSLLMSACFCLCFATCFTNHLAFAQVFAQGAHYRSELDDSLTIQTISVLPVSDNVSGIYSRPVEEALIQWVKDNHHWDYRESTFVGPVPSLEELEENPEKVGSITSGSDADALLLARVLKGPKGVSLKMDLFLVKDQKLLAQEISKNFQRYETPQIESKAKELLQSLTRKIPYSGLVLSRRNNRVTVNLGKKDGVADGQVIPAIQIIKTHRHPKFDFLINTEKEILGKIKILKAEDTLSFGTVITEKERGTIQKWTKVTHGDSIQYDAPESLAEAAKHRQDTRQKLDNNVAFGENAVEWLPTKPPTFGMAGILLGVGTYNGSVVLDSTGAQESKASFFPSIGLEAEMWLNPEWAVDFYWSQGIASSANPVAAASPEKLNHSLSAMGFAIAYNLLLHSTFFGPKIQFLGGFARYSDNVDDSDTQVLTSMTYSGPTLGIRGTMPVTPDRLWEAGIHFNMMLLTSLNETPVTSGASSSSTVNDFRFFVNRKISQNLVVTGRLNFLLTRASFEGTGTRTDDQASSASQKSTTFSGGVTYMF